MNVGDRIKIGGAEYKVSMPNEWDEYPCMGCCFDEGNGSCSLPLEDCVLMDEGKGIVG